MRVWWMSALLCVAQPAMAGPRADKMANAWMLSKVDGATVVKLLEEAGHQATLTQDPVGDPLVRGGVHGLEYVVLFYECVDGACAAMQYRAWFAAPGITAEAMNTWNQSNRLGRAYLDGDGDPTLEHNVRLGGGVSPEHLRAERDWFVRSLEAFRQMLSSESPTP